MRFLRGIGWMVLFLLVFGGVGYFWVFFQKNQIDSTLNSNRPGFSPAYPIVKSAPKVISPDISASPMAAILVSSPRAQSQVSRSFMVTGEARVFESVVSIRVRNVRTSGVLVNATAEAKSADAGSFGEFSYAVSLPAGNLKEGDALEVQVFEVSAKDGSDMDMVRIPVVFR